MAISSPLCYMYCNNIRLYPTNNGNKNLEDASCDESCRGDTSTGLKLFSRAVLKILMPATVSKFEQIKEVVSITT